MNINDFNRRWLEAWTDKDVKGVASFYSQDTRYFDSQVPRGLNGKGALEEYLTNLFQNTPPMTYRPETTWKIDGGFCGRWLCTIEGVESGPVLRGFDLCLVENNLIVHNEVYTHTLVAP